MKTLIIMRGLPGSGKSSVVKLLTTGHPAEGVICSADHYFEKDGEYRFDPKLLGKAHAASLKLAQDAMGAGVPLVIVDNTNTQRWEFEKYVEAAKEYGYVIHELTIGRPTHPSEVEKCSARNTHGVPKDAIKRMAERFEP
jgi:predicted kinase